MLAIPPQPKGGVNLSGGFPMEATAGISWTTCGGVCALTKAWRFNKPLFDIIVGGTTYTINSVNGYPDVKRLAALLGVSPFLGIKGAPCPKVYDQSGNGNNWIQATTANQPAVWLINGKVYLAFGGILSTNLLSANQFFNVAAGSYNNQAQSAFALVKPYSTTCASNSAIDNGCLWASGTHGSGGGAAWWPTSGDATNPPAAGVFDSIGFSIQTNLVAPNFGIQKSVASIVLSASNSTIWMDEFSVAGTAFSAGTATGGQIGEWTFGTFGYSGRMQALMIAGGTAFSSTQSAPVRNSLYALGGISNKNASTSLVNIVIDGASFSQGQGEDPTGLYNSQNGGGYGFWEMIMDQFEGYRIQWNNVAATGNTIANCTTRYPVFVANCFNASASINILVGPSDAYGNSIGSGGRTGAQAYSDFQAYATASTAQSWTKKLCTLYPDVSTAGAAYNALMIPGAAGNGFTMIDMTNDPAYVSGGVYANSDGHPTILGGRGFQGRIQNYLLPLL